MSWMVRVCLPGRGKPMQYEQRLPDMPAQKLREECHLLAGWSMGAKWREYVLINGYPITFEQFRRWVVYYCKLFGYDYSLRECQTIDLYYRAWLHLLVENCSIPIENFDNHSKIDTAGIEESFIAGNPPVFLIGPKEEGHYLMGKGYKWSKNVRELAVRMRDPASKRKASHWVHYDHGAEWKFGSYADKRLSEAYLPGTYPDILHQQKRRKLRENFMSDHMVDVLHGNTE